MSLWSRLFHAAEAAPAKLRDLARRIDDVEGELEHLAHQLKKLRGRVTGGVRQDEQEAAPEAPQLTLSPEVDQHARDIENGRLLVAMRGQRGILPR